MACLPAAYEVSCRIRTGSPIKLLAFIHPGRWQAVVLVPPLLGAGDLAGKPPAMWRRQECPPAPEGSQPLRAAEDGGRTDNPVHLVSPRDVTLHRPDATCRQPDASLHRPDARATNSKQPDDDEKG